MPVLRIKGNTSESYKVAHILCLDQRRAGVLQGHISLIQNTHRYMEGSKLGDAVLLQISACNSTLCSLLYSKLC